MKRIKRNSAKLNIQKINRLFELLDSKINQYVLENENDNDMGGMGNQLRSVVDSEIFDFLQTTLDKSKKFIKWRAKQSKTNLGAAHQKRFSTIVGAGTPNPILPSCKGSFQKWISQYIERQKECFHTVNNLDLHEMFARSFRYVCDMTENNLMHLWVSVQKK